MFSLAQIEATVVAHAKKLGAEVGSEIHTAYADLVDFFHSTASKLAEAEAMIKAAGGAVVWVETEVKALTGEKPPAP